MQTCCGPATITEEEGLVLRVTREDDGLISRARQGDESAWAELYAAHAGRLVVWLRTMPSGDAALTAEDMAADAWLTAAQSLSKFTGTGDDFAGWLFSIARNVGNNRRRTHARRATSPHSTTVSDGVDWGSTDDESSSVDGQDTTRRLLAHLSRREAEVIACIDVVGLDATATSQALGMSVTAVRVARHRGLKRLRAVLTESGADDGFAARPLTRPMGSL
jgi:RNA polymerase sigma-70 factor (ECF subfamily)